MYLALAGWTIHSTARRYCLRLRAFSLLEEDLMCSSLTLVRRFPNPILAGTRLQHWALLDVTVRC